MKVDYFLLTKGTISSFICFIFCFRFSCCYCANFLPFLPITFNNNKNHDHDPIVIIEFSLSVFFFSLSLSLGRLPYLIILAAISRSKLVEIFNRE